MRKELPRTPENAAVELGTPVIDERREESRSGEVLGANAHHQPKGAFHGQPAAADERTVLLSDDTVYEMSSR